VEELLEDLNLRQAIEQCLGAGRIHQRKEAA
jgi:hypothetical protein